MNQDMTVYHKVSPCILFIAKGPQKGSLIPLIEDYEYLIGKDTTCDIIVDSTDQYTSRKHAVLKVLKHQFFLKNLSKTNGTYVKGGQIDTIELKPGDQFQTGQTSFLIKNRSPQQNDPLSPIRLKIDLFLAHKRLKTIIGGLFILFILALIIVSADSKQTPEQFQARSHNDPAYDSTDMIDTNLTTSTQSTPEQLSKTFLSTQEFTNSQFSNQQTNNQLSIQDTQNSQQECKDVDELFLKGKIYYGYKQLETALPLFKETVHRCPGHKEAQQWLNKSFVLLDEEINQHMKAGLLHKKMMRFDQATIEFSIVKDLCRLFDQDQPSLCKQALIQNIDEQSGGKYEWQ